MPKTEYEEINLTLINKDLETTSEFKGRLLGQAVEIDESQTNLPQELIRIYQRKDGKFVSYMEYSDREDGVWESKMCVTDELRLAPIKRGLTRKGYEFENLTIDIVPSKALGVAIYKVVARLDG